MSRNSRKIQSGCVTGRWFNTSVKQSIVTPAAVILTFSLREKELAAVGLLVGRDSVEPNAVQNRPTARQSLALPITQTTPSSLSLRERAGVRANEGGSFL